MPDQILTTLLENNRRWAKKVSEDDPTFFEELAKLQSPEYLWIGCSDSRVPANQITGLKPGEVFVHRNIANQLPTGDLNSESVLQYAIEALKVKHIIICGHYGCGGVQAALHDQRLGRIDSWLEHIKQVHRKNKAEVEKQQGEDNQLNRLCELNVIEQVNKLKKSTLILDAWDRGQELTIHGWIYSLKDGVLKDLGVNASEKKRN